MWLFGLTHFFRSYNPLWQICVERLRNRAYFMFISRVLHSRKAIRCANCPCSVQEPAIQPFARLNKVSRCFIVSRTCLSPHQPARVSSAYSPSNLRTILRQIIRETRSRPFLNVSQPPLRLRLLYSNGGSVNTLMPQRLVQQKRYPDGETIPYLVDGLLVVTLVSDEMLERITRITVNFTPVSPPHPKLGKADPYQPERSGKGLMDGQEMRFKTTVA